MADRSGIEWTETTWNPTTGCDRTSPDCDNCYALMLAKRLKAMGLAKYQSDGDPRTSGPGFKLTLHPDTLAAPSAWMHRGSSSSTRPRPPRRPCHTAGVAFFFKQWEAAPPKAGGRELDNTIYNTVPTQQRPSTRNPQQLKSIIIT